MRIISDHWLPFYDADSQKTFNLDHLDVLTVNITQKPSKGKPAVIPCRITFSHHCFTDKLKSGQQCNPNQIYREPNREGRFFCIERYEASLNYLRELVETSFSNGNTKCFKDPKYRLPYFLIKGIDFHGCKVSYEVYFLIHKSNNDRSAVSVLIDTAFIRDSRNLKRIQKGKISIGVLANRKLKGN